MNTNQFPNGIDYYIGSGTDSINMIYFKDQTELSNDHCTIGAFKGDFLILSGS